MRPSEWKTLRGLFETLRTALSSLRQAVDEQTNSAANEQSAARETEVEKVEILRSLAHHIETSNRSATTAHHVDHRRHGELVSAQWWTVRWTAGACIAALIYASIAAYQGFLMRKTYIEIQSQTKAAQWTAKAAQEQASLLRQQLVGTQQAVIEIAAPQWDPTTGKLRITLSNQTHLGVAGTVTTFKASIQRKTWPKDLTIETLPMEILSPAVIGPQLEISKIVRLPQLENMRDWPGKEIVIFEGGYTYNNGFGESFPVNFCYLWTPPWRMDNGQFTGGGWQGRKDGCPSVREEIDIFNGDRKHVEETDPQNANQIQPG
jgi:hypothetical protein